MDNLNFNFSLINYSALFKNCIEIVNKYQSNKNLALGEICRLLNEKIDFYDWVGFYFLNEDQKRLVLFSFAGINRPLGIPEINFSSGFCLSKPKIES